MEEKDSELPTSSSRRKQTQGRGETSFKLRSSCWSMKFQGQGLWNLDHILPKPSSFGHTPSCSCADVLHNVINDHQSTQVTQMIMYTFLKSSSEVGLKNQINFTTISKIKTSSSAHLILNLFSDEQIKGFRAAEAGKEE